MLFFESKYMNFDDGCRCRRKRDEYFDILAPDKQLILRCRNTVRFPLSIIVNKPVIEDAAGKVLCHIDRPVFCSPKFTLRLPDGRTELLDTSVSACCGLDRSDSHTVSPCSVRLLPFASTGSSAYRWKIRLFISSLAPWDAISAMWSVGRIEEITRFSETDKGCGGLA